jgi:hypothetical protein
VSLLRSSRVINFWSSVPLHMSDVVDEEDVTDVVDQVDEQTIEKSVIDVTDVQ